MQNWEIDIKDNKDYYLLAIIIAVEIYVAIDSFLVCIELNPWLLYLISSIYPIEIISSKNKLNLSEYLANPSNFYSFSSSETSKVVERSLKG